MEDNQVQIAILAPIMAVRVGLRSMLGGNEGIEVVAEAADYDALSDYLPDVDVLILTGDLDLEDWQLDPDLESQIGLLWMTDDLQAASKLRQMSCRTWGIVPMDATEDELSVAVLGVGQGFIVAPRRILEPLWPEPLPYPRGDRIESLTPRESEVLQLLALGLANKHIAQELEISEHTVKFHVSSIYSKFGVGSRTKAVHLGLRLGIVSL
jgi:DNA-binding NarL/FixJ family response regulator